MNKHSNNNEKQEKNLNFIIFILIGTLILCVVAYNFINYSEDKGQKEMFEEQKRMEDDQSGWIENYVHLYNVDFIESEKMLTFKVENRSHVIIEGIKNIKLTLKSDNGDLIKYSFGKSYDLDILEEIEFNEKFSLKESERYELEVFVTYNNKDYSIGTTRFNVDEISKEVNATENNFEKVIEKKKEEMKEDKNKKSEETKKDEKAKKDKETKKDTETKANTKKESEKK